MALDKNQKILIAGGVAFAAIGIYLLWPKKASAAPRLPVSPTKPSTPVGPGAVNSSVQATQAALKAAGYDPGPADGQMGPKTAAALKAFQAAKGLPVTGQIDSATNAVLLGGAGAAKANTASPSTATPSTSASEGTYSPSTKTVPVYTETAEGGPTEEEQQAAADKAAAAAHKAAFDAQKKLPSGTVFLSSGKALTCDGSGDCYDDAGQLWTCDESKNCTTLTGGYDFIVG
jgi:peptidoglycan hydrolase-like protein with peptidoglycan-binding domain